MISWKIVDESFVLYENIIECKKDAWRSNNESFKWI